MSGPSEDERPLSLVLLRMTGSVSGPSEDDRLCLWSF